MNERDKQKTGQPEASEDELAWDSPDGDPPPAEPPATRPKRDSFIPLPQGFRQRRRDSESSGLDWSGKPPVRESTPSLRPPSRPPTGRSEPVAKPAERAKVAEVAVAEVAKAAAVAKPAPVVPRVQARAPGAERSLPAKPAEGRGAGSEARGQLVEKPAARGEAEPAGVVAESGSAGATASAAKASAAAASLATASAAKPSAVVSPPRVARTVDAPRAADASKISGDKIKPLEVSPIRAVNAAVSEPGPVAEAAPEPAQPTFVAEPAVPLEPAALEPAAIEPRPILAPRTLTPILGLAPARQPQLIYSQAGNPTPEMPIVYRERAYYVDSLLSDDELRDNLLRELGSLKEELRGWEQVKYVQLALFDHKFQRQPSGPPLATLSWKDWHSEPEIWVRGARRSGPPPEAEPSESRPDWAMSLDAYGPSTERGVAAQQQETPEPPGPVAALTSLEPTAPLEPIAAAETPTPVVTPEPLDVVEAAPVAAPEPVAAAPQPVAPSGRPQRPRSRPPRSLPPRSLPPRPKTDRPGSAPPIELSITDAPFSDDELLEGPPARSSRPAASRPLRPSARPPMRRSRAPREPELIDAEPESLEPEALEPESLREAPLLEESDAHAEDSAGPDDARADSDDDLGDATEDAQDAAGAAETESLLDELDERAPFEGTPQHGFPAPTHGEEPDEGESSPMPLVRRRTSMPAPGNDVSELEPYADVRQPEPTPTPVSGSGEEEPIPLVSIRPSRAAPPAPALSVVDERAEEDELLGTLFERMHELLYAPSITAGADFVLSVLAETMPCAGAIVHVFDRNDRTFLVVRAQGPNSERIVLSRTPENDARLGEVLRRARSTPSIPPPDPAATRRDAVPTASLWQHLGIDAQHTLAGPALHERSVVGLIELANPEHGGSFSDSESVALDYVLEQFADFVVKRAAELD